MNVVSAQEIKRIDRRAIKKYGIPGAVLMENAGREVVLAIIERYGDLTGKQISILAGKVITEVTALLSHAIYTIGMQGLRSFFSEGPLT